MSSVSHVDAKYEASYSLKYVNDTIRMTQGNEDRFTLLIADDITYWGDSYLLSQWDSIFMSSDFFEIVKDEGLKEFPK